MAVDSNSATVEDFPAQVSITIGQTIKKSGGWWTASVIYLDEYSGGETVKLAFYRWKTRANGTWRRVHKFSIDIIDYQKFDELVKRLVEKHNEEGLSVRAIEEFPAQVRVILGETLKKSTNWWSAVLVYHDEYSGEAKIAFYRWKTRKDGTWQRVHKFSVDIKDYQEFDELTKQLLEKYVESLDI